MSTAQRTWGGVASVTLDCAWWSTWSGRGLTRVGAGSWLAYAVYWRVRRGSGVPSGPSLGSGAPSSVNAFETCNTSSRTCEARTGRPLRLSRPSRTRCAKTRRMAILSGTPVSNGSVIPRSDINGSQLFRQTESVARERSGPTWARVVSTARLRSRKKAWRASGVACTRVWSAGQDDQGRQAIVSRSGRNGGRPCQQECLGAPGCS